MAKVSILGALRWSRFLRVVVPAVAGVVAASGPVLAQPGGRGGWRSLGEPGVTSQEIDRIDGLLDLGEDQRMVADELHTGYLSQVSALGEEVRKVMEAARDEFRESRNFEVWRDLGDVMRKYQEKKDELTDGFLSDVRLVLTPEQDARWGEVERFHRRYTTLGRDGLISGEGVDLIEAVGELDLDSATQQAVESTLDQYEVDVDRALIARNKAYDEGLSRGRAMFFEGEPGDVEKLFEEARDAAIKLRDVNRRYARQLMTALDNGASAKLQHEIDQRSFPRVYRETYAEKAFASVEGMDDLTEAQRERFSELDSSFRRELDTVNKRMAESIEKHEMERGADSLMPRRGPRGRRDEPEGLAEARRAKRELMDRYVDQLRGVLSESQRSRLPEREEPTNWREQVLSD